VLTLLIGFPLAYGMARRAVLAATTLPDAGHSAILDQLSLIRVYAGSGNSEGPEGRSISCCWPWG